MLGPARIDLQDGFTAGSAAAMLALIQDAPQEFFSASKPEHVHWFLADDDTSNALVFIGPLLVSLEKQRIAEAAHREYVN
jgi:hypothetical protein